MTETPPDAPLACAGFDAMVRRHGRDAVSFLGFESAMRHWSTAPTEPVAACVAYTDTGSAWVAAGAPLAESGAVTAAAERFVAAARNAGRRACFFATEQLEAPGFTRTRIGEQAIFRRDEWRAALGTRRRLREQLRRARAKGVRVRRVEAAELAEGTALRAQAERLAAEWLASRPMDPMSFLVALEPFREPGEHRYLAAERDGKLVELLSAVPIYGRPGWLVEDVLRGKDAPNGTTESLVHALIESVAEDEIVTLGLAPLTGPIASWLRAARFLARPLYSFTGLRAFKERLHPSAWEPVWLVVPRGELTVVHLFESLRAFAGGSLVRFAARSLWRHPGGPPYVLGLLLVPWTMLLALFAVLGRGRLLGFARPELVAWIAFDVAMVAALARIAVRPRPAWMSVAATAAAADALFSCMHLLHVGAGRTLAEHVLRALSAAAPAIATLTLARTASFEAARRRVDVP